MGIPHHQKFTKERFLLVQEEDSRNQTKPIKQKPKPKLRTIVRSSTKFIHILYGEKAQKNITKFEWSSLKDFEIFGNDGILVTRLNNNNIADPDKK